MGGHGCTAWAVYGYVHLRIIGVKCYDFDLSIFTDSTQLL